MLNIFLSDFGLFVGRFHPLLVHLPIGFLILAVLLEWWPSEKLRPAIRISWVAGAAAAIAAAGCGWLLAADAGDGDTLFWHRWLGITVAIMAIAGVWVTRKGGSAAKGFGLLVTGLLGIAGHQGGNLTHGETYLVEHAPAVVQKVAGYDGKGGADRDWSKVRTDSLYLYASFLHPALEESCTKCHNAGKQNGGLRLDKPYLAYLGGDSGPLFIAGSPLESEWLRRVTLPHDNVKAMPPQGDPWDYTTVALLEYWIASGADTLTKLSPEETPKELKDLLLRDYGLELRPKLFVETISAPALAPEKKQRLEAMNWSVSELMPDGGAIEVKVAPGKTLDKEALESLVEIAPEQITYLSLERLPFTDEDISPIAKLTNLNRLRLNQTGVTDKAMASLGKLPHLESLNLYGTAVGDEVFTHLAAMPALKRVYLWQTKVTTEAAEAFAKAHPEILVDTGFSFTPVEDQTTK